MVRGDISNVYIKAEKSRAPAWMTATPISLFTYVNSPAKETQNKEENTAEGIRKKEASSSKCGESRSESHLVKLFGFLHRKMFCTSSPAKNRLMFVWLWQSCLLGRVVSWHALVFDSGGSDGKWKDKKKGKETKLSFPSVCSVGKSHTAGQHSMQSISVLFCGANCQFVFSWPLLLFSLHCHTRPPNTTAPSVRPSIQLSIHLLSSPTLHPGVQQHAVGLLGIGTKPWTGLRAGPGSLSKCREPTHSLEGCASEHALPHCCTPVLWVEPLWHWAFCSATSLAASYTRKNKNQKRLQKQEEEQKLQRPQTQREFDEARGPKYKFFNQHPQQCWRFQVHSR